MDKRLSLSVGQMSLLLQDADGMHCYLHQMTHTNTHTHTQYVTHENYLPQLNTPTGIKKYHLKKSEESLCVRACVSCTGVWCYFSSALYRR